MSELLQFFRANIQCLSEEDLAEFKKACKSAVVKSLFGKSTSEFTEFKHECLNAVAEGIVLCGCNRLPYNHRENEYHLDIPIEEIPDSSFFIYTGKNKLISKAVEYIYHIDKNDHIQLTRTPNQIVSIIKKL